MNRILITLLLLLLMRSWLQAHDNHGVNVYEQPTFTAEKSAPQSERYNVYEMRHRCGSYCGHSHRVHHKHKAKFVRLKACSQYKQCHHKHSCVANGCHSSEGSCPARGCGHTHKCYYHGCHSHHGYGHVRHSRWHGHEVRSSHSYHGGCCSCHHPRRRRGKFLGIF